MWKVAFCVILVLEAHKKILGLCLSRKAEKVKSLFLLSYKKGVFFEGFHLERLLPLLSLTIILYIIPVFSEAVLLMKIKIKLSST